MSKAEQLEMLSFVFALVSALVGLGILTLILRRS
jgi:hypothetical protein